MRRVVKRRTNAALRALGAFPLLAGYAWCQTSAAAPAAKLDVPTIAAQAKGPNQINLTWQAVADAGYGYLVEIQSTADSRYGSWTELQPIPEAGGYTCDSTIFARGARCEVSDPAGVHVYNPPNKAIAPWVTDVNYVD